MKTGDEVYIKYKEERATRLIVDVVDGCFAWVKNDKEMRSVDCYTHLLPTDRLVSELPEIARMTGCYVAVDPDGRVVISQFKMIFDGEFGWEMMNASQYYPPQIIGTITCPNCERFDRQWGPDGEVL